MASENFVCVRVYFKEQEFYDVIKEAEKAGIRRVGLKQVKKVPHGWSGETVPNTKFLAKFLKFCFKEYKAGESDRAVKKALAKAKVDAAIAEAKEVGAL